MFLHTASITESRSHAMRSFLARYESQVKGVVSGFDRIRFRGTLRWLANPQGMRTWLSTAGVLLKDFRAYATGLTDQIKESTKNLAESAGRPLMYLPSAGIRKETMAREIAERDGVSSGLVCVLTAVEPCMTYSVGPNRQKKQLELRYHQAKCLHHYFYLIDPHWGWLNVRLQTWFPFTVQIVTNGRERLAQQLRKKGIEFERRENCFVDIADVAAAQRLLTQQRRTRWPVALNRITASVHKSHHRLFQPEHLCHYWSADETEWATDIMFRCADDLKALYPQLVRQAMTSFGGNDVLRFLGRRPLVQMLRMAEITSHLGRRAEGTRIKHSINRNSIKMYDKQESILRVETTINYTREMKVYRASEDDPEGPKSWQKLRKGVADLNRRAQISQASNERYLESLAAIQTDSSLAEATAQTCRRTTWKGRSIRALNPLADEDAKLLQAINQGEFAIMGFRNRDIRQQLFGPSPHDPKAKRSQAAKVTRLIRMLRAHGLIQKVAKTHRYTVTSRGKEVVTALLNARNAKITTLVQLAA
jgi:hypothetical protein